MNLQKMMKQAQEMQSKVAEMKERVDTMEADGVAGGGMVTVRINGANQMLKVTIDPSILKPEDKETLEDLFIVAYRSARDKLDSFHEEEMKKLSGGLNLPPGMKLPF